MGPLSGKQQREWLKHQAKEARESAKMEAEESRKNKLHEIKLQEAAAKANQGIGHKEEAHSLKMKELSGPLGSSKRINRQKLGLPSMNPLAGTEVLGQGQRMLPKGTDTVPAMLTPGEAVIPKAAAQDPKNKPMIKKMVQEGRAKQYAKGTTGVVQPENLLPIMPRVVPKRNLKGYENGTMSVNDYYAIGSESIPNVTSNYYHTDSAATMSDGTTNVQYLRVGDDDVQQLSINSGFTGELPADYTPVNVPSMVSDGVQIAGPVSAEDLENKRKQLIVDKTNAGIIGDFALGAAAAPASVVATPLAMGYNKLADAGEYVANSRLGNFVSGNTNELKIPRIERPNVVKANYEDTLKAIELRKAAAVEEQANKGQPKPVSLKEVSAKPAVTTAEVPAVPAEPKVFSKPTGEDAWVMSQESNGKIDAKNPNSSARGLYQMTDNAWKDAVLQNPNLKGIDRTTAEGQQAGRDAYKEVLSKQLLAKGITPTEEAIRKAWVVGASGYSNVYNGKPDAPLSLSAEAIRINPNLQGKTNAEFLADPNPYSRKGDIPEPRMQPKPTDPEQVRLAAAYKNFKQGGPLPEGAPAEVAARDARIAEYSQSLNKDEELNTKIQEIVQSKNTPPEEKKTLLTRMLENVWGPTGIFNERDLARFALTASASMLLGYNTNQSLRYAGRDTLAQADARYVRQQNYEQQMKAQDRADDRQDKSIAASDARTKETILAQDRRSLTNKLIDEGYSMEAINKYFQTSKATDLGSPRQTLVRSGESRTMMSTDPSMYNKPIVVHTVEEKTGKNKGAKYEVAIIDGKEVRLDALQKQGLSLVPFSETTHGVTGKQERQRKNTEFATKVAGEILETELGAENVKGKANPMRKGIPGANQIADQAGSYFSNIGFNLEDGKQMQEARLLMGNATKDMLADKNSGVTVNSIEPYLARNVITQRMGIDPNALMLSKDKAMNPEKIVDLNNMARRFSATTNGGKPNEAQATSEIQRLHQVWANPKSAKLREQFKGTSNETAFYQFASEALRKSLEK